MCGIVGILPRTPGDPERLDERVRRMASAIQHRGPDDSGFHITPNIALGTSFYANANPVAVPSEVAAMLAQRGLAHERSYRLADPSAPEDLVLERAVSMVEFVVGDNP